MENQVRDDAKRRAAQERDAWIRLIFVGLILVAIFVTIGVHIYKLQAEETHLQARAERQSTGRITLGAGGESHLDGHRGYIYDRHGYELAISVETPSVFAHPKKIDDLEGTALALSKALDIDITEIRKKLMSDAPFVWIARKTTPDKGAAVKALHLKGVGTKRESKRYYPGQELAGQILGFVGLDNVGLEGIEASNDKYLRGDVLRIKGMRDSRGRVILTNDSPRLNMLEGSSITLTLDQYIQKVSENALDRVCRKYSAKSAVAVVLDPYTGEVLAMANWPRFNPNRFKDYRKEDMRNRAVLDAYEPGSMMKLITYASAVDGAHVRPTDPISQNHGKIQIGKHSISDTHTIVDMTAETVVSESSNIGAYHLAQKLGKESFYNYLKKFGFGRRTGINIAGESAGILWNYKGWQEVMFANIAFGHGISVSPMQIAVAIGAIANGGNLMRPWLIREIRDHEGNVIQKGGPEVVNQAISEHSAATVRRAMERVVSEGTGMRAWVPGYRVGGKTGTAQKAERGRYTNKYMANFIGIAPIDDPNLVVVVMVDSPTPYHSGGLVTAPVFAEIVSQALPYRGVFPKTVTEGILDPFEMVTGGALADPETEGQASSETPVQPCGEFVTVPDFRGKSSLAALEAANDSCLGVNLVDSGFVATQWPAPGTRVSAHSRVELTLRSNYRTIQ
ncbi:MAG: PASTA domain-containing protein [Proteobacteria bacterium]|nr:PASTA domain-containing protein [Pseudomonadota bacterium]